MQEKAKFDQIKYITEYNKKNYKQFKVNLKHQEMEELNQLLKKYNLTKNKFLKLSIEKLKNNEF